MVASRTAHALLLALACAVTGLATASAPARAASCPGGPLLPDMSSYPPDLLAVREAGGHHRLEFYTGMQNTGAGPLQIVGRRPNRKRSTLRADQVLRCGDGSSRTRRGVSTMRYVKLRTHEHWHYRHFETYLLRVVGGSASRPGHKQGFCLGDDYDTATGDLPGKPARRIYSNDVAKACGASRPRALTVRLGVSVGWGDSYAPYVEGQYVDLTGLPAGTYRLINEVDRGRTLADANFADNVSGREIELAWPRGPAGPPAIEITGKCFSRTACGSPAPAPAEPAARLSPFERTGLEAGAAALLER